MELAILIYERKLRPLWPPNQVDSADGRIGANLFNPGLNIVGTQTTAATGRKLTVWGYNSLRWH